MERMSGGDSLSHAHLIPQREMLECSVVDALMRMWESGVGYKISAGVDSDHDFS